ncbi:MAG: hypothetical protein F6K09_24045 [Merismopedia sp. SIO2A8]|nr:hypothetical protein [Symploca sp. SIO2B6]NET51665.1 hypothetical protein [Merismopedia sp. SIO2A8]
MAQIRPIGDGNRLMAVERYFVLMRNGSDRPNPNSFPRLDLANALALPSIGNRPHPSILGMQFRKPFEQTFVL